MPAHQTRPSAKKDIVLRVLFDPETQLPGLAYNPEEFKRWEFIIAVLTMGLEHARDMKKLAEVNAMMAANAEANQQEQILQALNDPRFGKKLLQA